MNFLNNIFLEWDGYRHALIVGQGEEPPQKLCLDFLEVVFENDNLKEKKISF